MSTRVWKCDFCSITFKDILEIGNHEENCFNNPKNKKCGSCKHSDIVHNISGTYRECDIKDHNKIFEMEYNKDEQCDGWEFE